MASSGLVRPRCKVDTRAGNFIRSGFGSWMAELPNERATESSLSGTGHAGENTRRRIDRRQREELSSGERERRNFKGRREDDKARARAAFERARPLGKYAIGRFVHRVIDRVAGWFSGEVHGYDYLGTPPTSEEVAIYKARAVECLRAARESNERQSGMNEEIDRLSQAVDELHRGHGDD